MKFIITKHVSDKLQENEAIRLGIKLEHVLGVLKKPIVVDKVVNPHQSIGRFNQELSLSVIWKIEKGSTKVVTFYPAGKGRYESKILRRR